MSLFSIWEVPTPVDIDTYLGYSRPYTQVHVQYPYMTVLPDSYIPLTKPQFNLYTPMAILNYCENIHLLRHRSLTYM